MPEFGFPAQPQMSRMNRLIAEMRRDGDAHQFAAVTGRPADLAAHLDGRVNEAVLIGKTIADLEGYAQSIALAEARADIMQRSLGEIAGLAQNLANSASKLLTNGTDLNMRIVATEGSAALGGIVSALNARFAGRALFAGDDGNGNAVADAASIMAISVPILESAGTASAGVAALETEFTGTGGLFDTSIYTGGAGAAPRAEVASGEVIDYSVRADEAPIRQMLLNTVILAAAYDDSNAIPDPIRRELVELATRGLRNAVDGVINTQGRLGTAEARIATVKARNIAEEAALGVRFNEIAGADQYDAAFHVSEIENQLETALVTTARLSRLSLASYL